MWSQTYPAQNLNGFIPPAVTSRDDLHYIAFEPPAGGETTVSKPLALFFNPKKVPANIRALIVLPDFWITYIANSNVNNAVKQAFETRGVPCYPLKLWNAKYKNLAWFGANRNIEYIYFAGHGGYKLKEFEGVKRTTIELWDGYAVSAKNSDFEPNAAPPWCEPLPGSYERTTNSICRIGFTPGRLKFVHFDCCLAGRLRLTSDNRLVESPEGYVGMLAGPESDMSWALKWLVVHIANSTRVGGETS